MTLRISCRNGNGESVSGPASRLTEYLSPFENLLEFLSSLCGEGDSKRVRGTLMVTTASGKWSLKVKDHSLQLYAFVTSASLDDALETLEKGLGDDSLDWRVDVPYKAPKKN